MISNFDRRNCAIIAGSAIATYYLSTKIYRCYQKSQLTKKVQLKNQLRSSNFETIENLIFTNDANVMLKRQAIIEMNFDSLRKALQQDELTPTEVLRAFQWKSLEAQKLTNCICEFLTEATAWAKDLESKFKNTKSKPPFYGIPMSFKECNFVKGHDATMGMASYVNQPAEQDNDMVQIMKSLGAVPFCLTNVPQSMMSVGSSNQVYGITTNPYNSDLSPGGSSSGEGALIGSRGSPFGIGSDIGGSIRVPAHCCGICSLKPTCGRLPGSGQRVPELGISVVPATSGPMGIDVDSLIWFYRSIWNKDTKIADPTVVPLLFREDIVSSESKLTIGYYDYDGFIETTPATKRAVQMAKETLESMGHKLVRFDPPDVSELMGLYLACVLQDGGRYVGNLMKSDLLDTFHRKVAAFCSMPACLKRVIGCLVKPFSNQLWLKYGSFAASTAEMRNKFNEMYGYKMKFIAQWTDAKLDCILCPVMASTALTPEHMAQLFAVGWTYTALYNALDFPAGVVPCIMTNNSDDENMKSYKTDTYYSKFVKKSFDKSAKRSMPVAVQLVTLPYQEELCLRVMKELEDGLKQRKYFRNFPLLGKS